MWGAPPAWARVDLPSDSAAARAARAETGSVAKSAAEGGVGGSGLGGQVAGGAGGSPVMGGRTGAAGSGAGGFVVCSPTTPCDSGAGGDSGPVKRDSGADLRDAGGDGVAGAGGAIATGGNSGTGGSACVGLASNEELIDDLNDGDRFIPSVNGRAGASFDSHDSSPGGKMYPDPNTGFSPTDTGDSCRKFAAYVTGSGYVLWGADLWFGLGSPYDASKYKGISFWAKIDAGTSSVCALPSRTRTRSRKATCARPTSRQGRPLATTTTVIALTLVPRRGPSTPWPSVNLPKKAGDTPEVHSTHRVSTKSCSRSPWALPFGIWIDDVAFTM